MHEEPEKDDEDQHERRHEDVGVLHRASFPGPPTLTALFPSSAFP